MLGVETLEHMYKPFQVPKDTTYKSLRDAEKHMPVFTIRHAVSRPESDIVAAAVYGRLYAIFYDGEQDWL